MLNLFYNKLWYLKVEIYCKIKQYSSHTESPVVKSIKKKKEVTVHFKQKAHFIEDTVYIVCIYIFMIVCPSLVPMIRLILLQLHKSCELNIALNYLPLDHKINGKIQSMDE
jgi:hypothetical protein